MKVFSVCTLCKVSFGRGGKEKILKKIDENSFFFLHVPKILHLKYIRCDSRNSQFKKGPLKGEKGHVPFFQAFCSLFF